MFCPKCARKNSDQNKFCNGCGATLSVEVIPPPPPPPPNARFSAESSKELKIAPDSFAKIQAIEKNDKNLHSDEIVKSDKPESRSNEFKNEKNASEMTAPVAPEQQNSSDQTVSQSELLPAETFDDYLSDIKDKYNNSQTISQTSRKNHLIIAGAAIVILMLLGGLVAIAGYFMSRNELASSETVAKNKNAIDEKPKTSQMLPPPEMVFVTGGEFMMGSDLGDKFSVPPSSPAHRVSVKSFLMDKTEVTCEEYKKFVDAAGYKSPSGWQNNDFPAGSAKKPVTGIDWDDANAFAKWKNKRLPTEEEWEFAARGTDGRIYPWGDDWKSEMANADKQKPETQEVALSGGQSPFGVFDMSGNAWEWTASEAKPYSNYKSSEADYDDLKIIRGGFFGSSKERATTTFRGAWGARGEKSYSNTSFRCVRDVPAN